MALSASLSLQAILKAAATRAGMTAPARRVHGLSDGAAALCVAGAAARDRAVVLVVPDDAQVERATTDIRFFLGVLEGLSSDVAERVVLPFPSPQVDPYRGLAPHLLVASARARALHALAAGKVRIVVASGPALLPRLAEQERLLRASTVLKPGDDVPLDELAALLVDAGFTHEDPVDEHGEFCIRGGIVDVYPASDAQPTRLEFVGDTIESIRAFDSGTQRSIATLDQLTIIPLREQFTVGPDAGPGVSLDELTGPADDEADSPGPESNGARACTFFDYLP